MVLISPAQEFDLRMAGIIRCLKDLRPGVSVACLQEATPRLLALLRADSEISATFDLSADSPDLQGGGGGGDMEDAMEGYGVLTLTAKQLQCRFCAVSLPSDMGRQLLLAVPGGGAGALAVGNVHLESLDSHAVRERQLRECHAALLGFSSALLVGDFNFCSLRNFHCGRGVLENDSLATCLPGFLDVWLQLHPPPGPLQEGQEEVAPCTPPPPASAPCTPPPRSSSSRGGGGGAAEGFTFDSARNGLLAHKHERMRYDRVMLRSLPCSSSSGGGSGGGAGAGAGAGGWAATSMRLLGTEPLDARQLLSLGGARRGHVSRGLWASDHFGLSCTLSLPRPAPSSSLSPS
jgi:hypothetical protein